MDAFKLRYEGHFETTDVTLKIDQHILMKQKSVNNILIVKHCKTIFRIKAIEKSGLFPPPPPLIVHGCFLSLHIQVILPVFTKPMLFSW